MRPLEHRALPDSTGPGSFVSAALQSTFSHFLSAEANNQDAPSNPEGTRAARIKQHKWPKAGQSLLRYIITLHNVLALDSHNHTIHMCSSVHSQLLFKDIFIHFEFTM